MKNRKRYIVEELRVMKRVVLASSHEEIEAKILATRPANHKTVSLVIKPFPTLPPRSTSLVCKEDFIEMLARGDSFEHIARVAGVKVKSVEARYYRIPANERPRIRRNSFGWRVK